jgi:alkanesulfonate monooxygenase SsuD/methylene tetrahydromethanopterin reductase-like flavin-dependent oxidoreductase (luciferase family)
MSFVGTTATLRRPDVYLLSFGDHLPDPATGTTPSEGERIRSVVEQAVVAERYGFTGVAIGEHHFMAMSSRARRSCGPTAAR